MKKLELLRVPPINDILLDRKELAQHWKCSTETIKRREAAGKLKSVKIGRLIRYRMSDIKASENLRK